MDPVTLMALASTASGMFGGKQLGDMAPAPNLGTTSPFTGMFPEMNNPYSGMSLLENLQQSGFGGALTKLGQPPVDEVPEEVQQDPLNLPGKESSPFKDFMGGLDKGLQSPSQLLGLGLLSQLTDGHPAAGIGGLLAMGLLNK